MKEKIKKYDKAIVGVIVGALLPILGFLISYPIKTWGMDISFERYMNIAQVGQDRQSIMIFCMLPNMFLFYFTNFRWDFIEFTKGLVAVTILLGLLLVITTLL